MSSAPDRSKPRTPLRAGIYAPTLTFFDPVTEELDIDALRRHVVRIASAGLVGIITMGSSGEAVHLSRLERAQVISATREALDEEGFRDVPVIAGVGQESVRGSVELCQEAKEAGAEYALLIPPSYFRAATTDTSLQEFFAGVAEASPLPIIIYNYPAATGGIDMDSDFIIRLSQHPNIVGTKFTCGNIGKLARVARALNAVTTSDRGSGYMAFGGMADITAQTACSGGSGIIAGSANVVPKLIVKVWELWTRGHVSEAMDTQKLVSEIDWLLIRGGVPSIKQALETHWRYGGFARRPLKRLKDHEAKDLQSGIREAIFMEQGI